MPDVKFSNQYPYTDFHELNLDWVISQVKYWSERVGKSIQTITKTGTAGLVDTYTITYSDDTTSTFDVTNGNGIASIAKTGTVGLVDTYTITFQDGSTSTFEVHNGTASIDSTLTLSDYAADAKATGDAITDVKTAFTDNNAGHIPVFVIPNEYVKNTDGTFAPYSGWSRSDYIPINKYHSFKCQTSATCSYNAMYTANKDFIDYFYIRDTETEVIIPDNAYYMAISNTDAGIANTRLVYKTKDEYAIEQLQDEMPVNVFGTRPGNINVLDPDNFTLAGYINATDGETFVSDVNYMCTNDYIDIPFGTSTIYAKFPQIENINRICCFLFYDKYDNYMFSSSGRFDGYDYTTATLNPTDDVAKLKFWVNKTTVSGGSNDTEIAFSAPAVFEAFVSSDMVDNAALETPDIYLPLKGKRCVCFGDSIFGNKRSPFGITDALEDITGATIYNMGFGGCDMAARTSADWDAFSMYRLAYSIAHNNFSVQNAVDVDNVPGMQSYFKKSRTILQTIDFDTIDYITIAYGTNDFTGDVLLDNPNDPFDCDTFCGALRYSLNQINTAFPHIKIFVCGQTYRFWLDSDNVFIDDSDTHENGNNDKLTDFIQATKTTSEEYHVPFIDNYNIGINKVNRNYYFPTGDGTHQNYLGAELIAEHIKHHLF